MPSVPLNAIVFPAPVVVPPMVVCEAAPPLVMPLAVLPRPSNPVASVPIRLPSMTLYWVPLPTN